jgi:hypothetical protein
MAVSATNTFTGKGIAEDFEDVIFNISPEETPLLSMCKRKTATQQYHQWQTDSLSAASANNQLEGDDASFATLAATTVLGNYNTISRKTVQISGTYDAVKKYGRKSQVAYQLMKAGKELKRDIDYSLSRNSASRAGSAGTARLSAGLESWISGNRVKQNTGATTPGFSSGTVAAPTDGTAKTFTEAIFKTALSAAWTDGGQPTTILMSATNKARFSAFAGIATKYNDVTAKAAQIIGAAEIYVSDFGNHTVSLSRQVRDNAVLCIDPDYVSVAFLRPIQKDQLAKTGDSEKHMILAEYCLVVDNPDAHAKVQGTGA